MYLRLLDMVHSIASFHARVVPCQGLVARSQVSKVMSGFADGFRRPGLACESCGAPFARFLVVEKMVSIQKLPDLFLAKCPRCGHQASYPKSAIATLVAVGRQ
jgi:hypothetical protein